MQKKTYLLENLDCANCAAKIEAKMNALPEVELATIVFTTMQLQLTAEDPDALIAKLTEIGRSVEPDFEIHNRKEHHTHQHSHTHSHEHGCDCCWNSWVWGSLRPLALWQPTWCWAGKF